MSDAPKHTPGPWIMAASPSSVVGWPIVSPSGRSICSLNYVQANRIDPKVPGDDAFNAESRANGRLIAAAPELLEALKQVMGWIDGWSPNFTLDDDWPEAKHHILAAIAKAEGRQP